MKDLKEIIGNEEKFNQVSELLGSDTMAKLKEWIPISRLESKNATITELEDQIAELSTKYDTDLAKFNEISGNKEETDKLLETLKAENAQAKQDLENAKIEFANNSVKSEWLTEIGVTNAKAKSILMNELKDAQIKDGKIIGASDYEKSFKEDPTYKPWFGKDEFVGQDHQTGEQTKTLSKRQQLETALKTAQENRDTVLSVSLTRQLNELKE